MSLKRKFVLAGFVALMASWPAAAAFTADSLSATLEKLNQAAAQFHSTSADFKFVTEQTEPVPDTDTLEGVAYYQRVGKDFEMSAHIAKDNGQPAPKVYMFVKGQFKLYEPGLHQLTILKRGSEFQDYIMLGFGASGNQLKEKWEITDLGPETIGGVRTEKLDLIAKDPKVKQTLPKVTVWMDLDRAVSLRQVFDMGHGQTRTCTYTNIKTNQSLPGGVFAIDDSKALANPKYQ